MSVSVSVCVFTTKASGVILTVIPVASQFQFIAIAIDIKDGFGSINKMRLQLQPKKTKVTLYLPLV